MQRLQTTAAKAEVQADLVDPSTYAEVMSRPNAERWQKNMCEEMDAQHKNRTWGLEICRQTCEH